MFDLFGRAKESPVQNMQSSEMPDGYSFADTQTVDDMIRGLPVGNAEAVEKLVMSFVSADLEAGKGYYSTVWAHAGAVDSALSVSRGIVMTDNFATLAENPDSERIRLGEAQNQLETMKSLFKDSLFGKGDFYKIVPSKGESQNRCDVIKSGIDTILAKNKFEEIAKTAINDILLYKYAAIKAYKAIKKTYFTRRKQVQFGTPEYDELSQNKSAYAIDGEKVDEYNVQQQKQQAQTQFMASSGQMQQPPQPIEPPVITFVVREEFIDSEIQLSNVSPKNICFSDGISKFDDQPAVHEAHSWTYYELEANSSYFQNYESLFNNNGEFGSTSEGSLTAAPNVSGFTTSPNFERKRIWESWITIPFDSWKKNNKINDSDLKSFEELYGLPEGETAVGQRWCIYHCDDKILCILPNTRTDKYSHPYHCATFRDLKLFTTGESFYDIISGLCKRLDMAMQDLAYNIAIRGGQPVMFSGKLGLTDNEVRKMRRPRELTAISANINSLKDCIFNLETPDISGALESYIGFLGSRVDQIGVNQTMLGVDKSRSATGAAINQQYGNIRIKGPFEDLCKVILDCLNDVLHSMLLLSSEKSLCNLLGDSYAVLNTTLQNITSEEIDKKFQLQMTCSFNNPALMVQQMITLANVYLGSMSPELMKEWMIVTAEMMGIPKSTLDRISDSVGLASDAKAELETILNDKTADVASQIRITDNHQQCLDMARLYSARHPEMLIQKNFMEYVEAHMTLLQQQMMMQQQQMMGTSAPNPGQGNSNDGSSMKPPENGGDDQSAQRQMGQAASPPDSGTETSGGLTGTNSTPSFPNKLA